MLKEILLGAIHQIIPPKPSPNANRFMEDLATGKIPQIKNYSCRSVVDYYGRNKKGEEIVMITNPVVGIEERSYRVLITPTGEVKITYEGIHTQTL